MLSAEDIKEIQELEKKLTLPVGFCTGLIQESDWSFVIKLHAVFEAAMSRLLAHHLGRDDLTEVFARLDMSSNGYGKLAFAKALGYVEDEERRLIRKWSELRNVMVHDVTNTSFDLSAHLALLDDKATKAFLKGFYIEGYFQPDIRTPEGYARARDNPKEFLFLGAMSLLWQLSNYFEWADHDRELERVRWLQSKLHLKDDAETA